MAFRHYDNCVGVGTSTKIGIDNTDQGARDALWSNDVDCNVASPTNQVFQLLKGRFG